MTRALPAVPTSALADWSPCGKATDLARAEQLARKYRRDTWTALEILSLEEVSAADRLWVVLREEMLPARVLRLCAADYAERALLREREAGREPDLRSWAAIEVARRYATGDATAAELVAAGSAAGSAAWAAASDAASDVAWAAASDVAWAAASDAAWAAASDAAWDAASDARVAACEAKATTGDAAQAARNAEARAQVAITIQRALEWAGAPEAADLHPADAIAGAREQIQQRQASGSR